jgi:hypothetical protein
VLAHVERPELAKRGEALLGRHGLGRHAPTLSQPPQAIGAANCRTRRHQAISGRRGPAIRRSHHRRATCRRRRRRAIIAAAAVVGHLSELPLSRYLSPPCRSRAICRRRRRRRAICRSCRRRLSVAATAVGLFVATAAGPSSQQPLSGYLSPSPLSGYLSPSPPPDYLAQPRPSGYLAQPRPSGYLAQPRPRAICRC